MIYIYFKQNYFERHRSAGVDLPAEDAEGVDVGGDGEVVVEYGFDGQPADREGRVADEARVLVGVGRLLGQRGRGDLDVEALGEENVARRQVAVEESQLGEVIHAGGDLAGCQVL